MEQRVTRYKMISNNKESKVVIISSSFIAGNAITGLNLFSKWNKKNLYCATMSKLSFEHIDSFDSMYFLGDKERYSILPFNSLLPIAKSCIISEPQTESHLPKLKKKNRIRAIYNIIVNPLLSFFGFYDRRFKYKVSDDFKNWVNTIKPDYFYSHIGSYGLAEFAIEIQKEFPDIKFITHSYDDWSNRNNASINLFKRIRDYKSNLLLNQIIKKSYLCFATSELMAEEFQKSYHREFQCFYNPARINYNEHHKISDQSHHTITYIGKIANHNKDAIADMIKAIDIINKKSEIRILFNIYSPNYEKDFKVYFPRTDSTVYHNPLPHNRIVEVLSKSSFVFLPITISKNNIAFTRYSFSTKISEYCASRVPILYYGPYDIAMAKILIDNDSAFYLSERNLNKLIDLLINAITNYTEIEKKVQNAFNLVKGVLDIDIISKKYYSTLNKEKKITHKE